MQRGIWTGYVRDVDRLCWGWVFAKVKVAGRPQGTLFNFSEISFGQDVSSLSCFFHMPIVSLTPTVDALSFPFKDKPLRRRHSLSGHLLHLFLRHRTTEEIKYSVSLLHSTHSFTSAYRTPSPYPSLRGHLPNTAPILRTCWAF